MNKVMETCGIWLLLIGGTLFFVSSIAIGLTQRNSELSAWDLFDVFMLGGLITFFRDLFRGIDEGFEKRSSLAFFLAVLLGVSLLLIVVGIALLIAS